MMGYKPIDENKLRLYLTRIGKFYKKKVEVNLKFLITKDTIIKLRSRGVMVRIYDKPSNLVKEFKIIKYTASSMGLFTSSISERIKHNNTIDSHKFFGQ